MVCKLYNSIWWVEIEIFNMIPFFENLDFVKLVSLIFYQLAKTVYDISSKVYYFICAFFFFSFFCQGINVTLQRKRTAYMLDFWVLKVPNSHKGARRSVTTIHEYRYGWFCMILEIYFNWFIRNWSTIYKETLLERTDSRSHMSSQRRLRRRL